MPNGIKLTPQEAKERLVRHRDMVACEMAFIDCKIPGSDQKVNYSLIGPGVSEATDQFVNLAEPHGFSLGVAAMPPGVTNNLHIHYTAEVFMIFEGEWLFRWGREGDDGEIIGRAGDVVSIPTWIFRGFSNIGDNDGWIFTALGRDDCGGLIWHPGILKQAADLGVYLTDDDVVVDTTAGAVKPDDQYLVKPLTPKQMAMLDEYSVDQMLKRVVPAEKRRWSKNALLAAMVPGIDIELAPVIGPGMTEDRSARAPVTNPHGFCIEWLRIPANTETGFFCVSKKQVMIVFGGELEIDLNRGYATTTLKVCSQDLYSTPADVWRQLRTRDQGALVAVITAGDGRTIIEWDDAVIQNAAAAGYAVDPDGYIARRELLFYLHDKVSPNGTGVAS